jgi:fibronectin type 3 domain-containing protein
LKFLFCIVLSSILLSGCGKVGEPQPPFIRIPEAVKDLSVTQSGHTLVLQWTNPPRFVDGSGATNLARVRIRSNGVLITAVEVTAAGQPQSYPIAIERTAGEGRSFTVIVESTQGKLSDVSNTASITPVEVPGAVSRLTATPDQRRIFLKWEKPAEHPELADTYAVTRSDFPGETETVMETAYEDTRYPQGKAVTFQVTAGRRVAGTLVMGLGPVMRMITIEDKTPPGSPNGLEVTPSDTGALVTWEANPETDLAGYRLFRSERPDGGFKVLTDRLLMSNSFFDAAYKSELYYGVSAIDESGNVSAMSAPYRRP